MEEMDCNNIVKSPDSNNEVQKVESLKSLELLKKKLCRSHDLIQSYNDKYKECEQLKISLRKARAEANEMKNNYNNTLSKLIKQELQNTEQRKQLDNLSKKNSELETKISGDQRLIQQLNCKIDSIEEKNSEKLMDFDLTRLKLEEKIKTLEQEGRKQKKSPKVVKKRTKNQSVNTDNVQIVEIGDTLKDDDSNERDQNTFLCRKCDNAFERLVHSFEIPEPMVEPLSPNYGQLNSNSENSVELNLNKIESKTREPEVKSPPKQEESETMKVLAKTLKTLESVIKSNKKSERKANCCHSNSCSPNSGNQDLMFEMWKKLLDKEKPSSQNRRSKKKLKRCKTKKSSSKKNSPNWAIESTLDSEPSISQNESFKLPKVDNLKPNVLSVSRNRVISKQNLIESKKVKKSPKKLNDKSLKSRKLEMDSEISKVADSNVKIKGNFVNIEKELVSIPSEENEFIFIPDSLPSEELVSSVNSSPRETKVDENFQKIETIPKKPQGLKRKELCDDNFEESIKRTSTPRKKKPSPEKIVIEPVKKLISKRLKLESENSSQVENSKNVVIYSENKNQDKENLPMETEVENLETEIENFKQAFDNEAVSLQNLTTEIPRREFEISREGAKNSGEEFEISSGKKLDNLEIGLKGIESSIKDNSEMELTGLENSKVDNSSMELKRIENSTKEINNSSTTELKGFGNSTKVDDSSEELKRIENSSVELKRIENSTKEINNSSTAELKGFENSTKVDDSSEELKRIENLSVELKMIENSTKEINNSSTAELKGFENSTKVDDSSVELKRIENSSVELKRIENSTKEINNSSTAELKGFENSTKVDDSSEELKRIENLSVELKMIENSTKEINNSSTAELKGFENSTKVDDSSVELKRIENSTKEINNTSTAEIKEFVNSTKEINNSSTVELKGFENSSVELKRIENSSVELKRIENSTKEINNSSTVELKGFANSTKEDDNSVGELKGIENSIKEINNSSTVELKGIENSTKVDNLIKEVDNSTLELKGSENSSKEMDNLVIDLKEFENSSEEIENSGEELENSEMELENPVKDGENLTEKIEIADKESSSEEESEVVLKESKNPKPTEIPDYAENSKNLENTVKDLKTSMGNLAKDNFSKELKNTEIAENKQVSIQTKVQNETISKQDVISNKTILSKKVAIPKKKILSQDEVSENSLKEVSESNEKEDMNIFVSNSDIANIPRNSIHGNRSTEPLLRIVSPKKPGRKKKLVEVTNLNPRKSTRGNLLTKLRTLKKRSREMIIATPAAKKVEVKPEIKLEVKLEVEPEVNEDSNLPASKKRRIAHTPRSDDLMESPIRKSLRSALKSPKSAEKREQIAKVLSVLKQKESVKKIVEIPPVEKVVRKKGRPRKYPKPPENSENLTDKKLDENLENLRENVENKNAKNLSKNVEKSGNCPGEKVESEELESPLSPDANLEEDFDNESIPIIPTEKNCEIEAENPHWKMAMEALNKPRENSENSCREVDSCQIRKEPPPGKKWHDFTDHDLHPLNPMFDLMNNKSWRNDWNDSITTQQKFSEKNVRLELSRLADNETWTNDLHFEVVTNISQMCDVSTAAKAIVYFLQEKCYDGQPLDKSNTPPAPMMTRTQQKIVTLISALEKPMPKIYDLIFDGINYALFRLGHAPDKCVIEGLSRIYTILSRLKKDRERARLLIVDALYCFRFNAFYLIFVVLTCWAEVFPICDSNLEILPKCMAFIIQTSEDNLALKNLISNYYQYPKSEYFADKLAVEFLTALEKKHDTSTDVAIILLAKKMGAAWTQKKIIQGESGLKQLIVTRRHPSPYDAFNLLGNLMRSFPEEDKQGHIKEIIEQLCDLLNSDEGSEDHLEGVASALLCFTKFKQFFAIVARSLFLWKPKRQLRDETLSKFKYLFTSRHKIWWYKFIKNNYTVNVPVPKKKASVVKKKAPVVNRKAPVINRKAPVIKTLEGKVPRKRTKKKKNKETSEEKNISSTSQ